MLLVVLIKSDCFLDLIYILFFVKWELIYLLVVLLVDYVNIDYLFNLIYFN